MRAILDTIENGTEPEKKEGSFAMDLGEFYEKHKSYFYWRLSRKLINTGLTYHAEDIIHDVVVSMIANEERRAKFEGLTETEAKAYFMTCLTHRMIDLIRREQRSQEYLRMLMQTESQETMKICSVENSVMEHLDEVEGIQEIFSLLTKQERELLYLVFIQNLSYREVALRSRLREHAVAMRILRLKKKLLKVYAEQKERTTKNKFGSCKAKKPVLL